MQFDRFSAGLFLFMGVLLAFLSANPFHQPVTPLDQATVKMISAIFISTAAIVFAVSNKPKQ